MHDTFYTPDKTGKKAHARVEDAGARKIVLIARIDAVYRVGMFRMSEYDDTKRQARNASRTA